MKKKESNWFQLRKNHYNDSPKHVQVFCFPFGGGGDKSFQFFSLKKFQNCEIFTLVMPGRGNRYNEEPITFMPKLIPILTNEMKKHFLKKPFVFFGHSVGAVIALELVNSLVNFEKRGNLFLRLFCSGHITPRTMGERYRGKMFHKMDDKELFKKIVEFELMRDNHMHDNVGYMSENDIKFLTRPMKDDFELTENFKFEKSFRKLNIPLTIINGENDKMVPKNDLLGWKKFSKKCDFKIFEGGHFYYLETINKDTFSNFLLRKILKDLEEYPISIMDKGEESYEEKCIHNLFKIQASKTPDSPAVVGVDKTFTFKELHDASTLIARFLQSKGVKRGDLVGIYMDHCVNYVMVYLGILMAGAGFLIIDNRPPEILGKILDNTNPKFIFVIDKYEVKIRGTKFSKKYMVVDGNWKKKFDLKEIPPLLEYKMNIDDVCLSVTTSGTTGVPKAIIGPHKMLVYSYHFRNTRYPFKGDDREGFNIFFNWEIMRPLIVGYPVYVIPDNIITNPIQLVKYLKRNKITKFMTTPTLLETFLNTDVDLEKELPLLNLVWVNGECLPSKTWEVFKSTFPNTKLVNLYSISECFDITSIECHELDLKLSPKIASCGYPIPNVVVYVLDSETKKPVLRGLTGEIYVGGINLSYGYKGNKEKTKLAFVKDTIKNDGSMMYKTGDLGRILFNGQLEISGRADFMIKIRGYRVQLENIQNTISKHPSILTSIVLAKTENNVTESLVAFIVPRKSEKRKNFVKLLRVYLKNKLEHYAIPSTFIVFDKLPMSELSGKVDKKKLLKLVVEKKKNTFIENANSFHQVNQCVLEVWRSFLDEEEIEKEDNFFDIGGHSLVAVEVCKKVTDILSMEVCVVDLYQYPTLGEFELYVKRKVTNTVKRNFGNINPRKKEISQSNDIAVIGIGCEFPGAKNKTEFWKNICNGICSIKKLTVEELKRNGVSDEHIEDPNYVRFGGLLDDLDKFDYKFFGLSKREAKLIDPQHRKFLEICWKAMEDAGYSPNTPTANLFRTGVFGGSHFSTYLMNYVQNGGKIDEKCVTDYYLAEIGNDKDYITTRVSNLLNLKGPSINIQTSCSTSLVAVAVACEYLLANKCDIAMAGGSKVSSPHGGYFFEEGMSMMSKRGECKPFDSSASGTVFSNGVGVVVLKRLEDAINNKDDIYAVIKGFATNNDGKEKANYNSPSVKGQSEVIEECYRNAGVNPDSISLIEAHGSSTSIGDPIEVKALSEVFRKYTNKKGFCVLDSVKANIGHTDVAAGIAGFIKAIMCLKNSQIPPNISVSNVNQKLSLSESPFRINKKLTKWDVKIKRVGVSSFGIGGTNCHVVLEEGPKLVNTIVEDAVEKRNFQMITLSASSKGSLELMKKEMINFISTRPKDYSIGSMELNLHLGRNQFNHRIGFVCRGLESLNVELLKAKSCVSKGKKKRIIFLFSGQGTQYEGMGKDLYTHEPLFRVHFNKCRKVFKPLLEGTDLLEVLSLKRKIKNSIFEQSLLFSVEYSVAKCLEDLGIVPSIVFGHSLGELIAACFAEIISLENIAIFIVERAKEIERSSFEGKMLSINLSEKEIEKLIRENSFSGKIFISIKNSHLKNSVSGGNNDIEAFRKLLDTKKILYKTIGVNRAYHSPLLKKVSTVLYDKMKKKGNIFFSAPRMTLLSNKGHVLTTKECCDLSHYCNLIAETVNFTDNIQYVIKQNPTCIVTIGSRALNSLITKTNSKQIAFSTFPHPSEIKKTLESYFFFNVLMGIWKCGVTFKWHSFHKVFSPGQYKKVHLPTYKFDGERCWLDVHNENNSYKRNNRRDMDQWMYESTWKRTILPRSLNNHKNETVKKYIILAQSKGTYESLCTSVVNMLKKNEKNEVIVFHEQAKVKEVLKNHFENIKDISKSLEVIYMWSLTSNIHDDDLSHYNDYLNFLKLLKTFTNLSVHLSLILNNSVAISDDYHERTSLITPHSLLHGLTIVFQQEYPEFCTKIIDIHTKTSAKSIFLELTKGYTDGDLFIALRRNKRFVQIYKNITLPKDVFFLGDSYVRHNELKGSYIITGGLGRIGLVICEYLLSQKQNVVLVTRKQREVQKINQMEEQYSMNIHIINANMSVLQDVKKVFTKTFEKFGGIKGIFHCAGVMNIIQIRDLNEVNSQELLKAKVMGTINMNTVINELILKEKIPPNFVMLFSSLSAVLGGYGMGGYAAANKFMDSFAQKMNASYEEEEEEEVNMKWISINFDDWKFKYKKNELIVGKIEKFINSFAISPKEGINVIRKILGCLDLCNVIISTRKLNDRIKGWIKKKKEVNIVEDESISSVSHDACEKEMKGGSELERKVLMIYRDSLGNKKISVNDNFFNMGGDSLLAAHILKNVRKLKLIKKKEVLIRDVFEKSSVKEMAEWLSRE